MRWSYKEVLYQDTDINTDIEEKRFFGRHMEYNSENQIRNSFFVVTGQEG